MESSLSHKEILSLVEELLGTMCFPGSVMVEEEDGAVRVEVDTDDPALLIGYRGETLRALEHLTRLLVLKKTQNPVRIMLDVNQYRRRRIQALEELAKASADQARFSRESIELEPMSAFERRVVHMALSHRPDVMTESVGEGFDRRVVVKPSLL